MCYWLLVMSYLSLLAASFHSDFRIGYRYWLCLTYPYWLAFTQLFLLATGTSSVLPVPIGCLYYLSCSYWLGTSSVLPVPIGCLFYLSCSYWLLVLCYLSLLASGCL